MSEINIHEVQSETKNVVRQASRDNTLHEITPRQIRQRVEKQLELDEGTLDAKEYRDAVKAATAEAINELESAADEPDEEVNEPVDVEKPKKSAKRKSDTAVAAPKKKARTEKAKPNENAKVKDSSKKAKGQRVVRSASVVPSSDDEDGSRQASTSKVAATRHEKPDNDEQNASVHEASDLGRKAKDPQLQDNTPDQDSNVLGSEGEAPKPASSKKVTKDSKEKATQGRKRKAKEATDESPEDQEIKRLKSFVTACGVRKVWSKEFKDIPDDKHAQTRRLRSLLADLGMTGRLSLEKAKAIRAKRELAQELEDVQSFEKAVVNGTTRSRRSQVQGRPKADQSDDEDEDVPRKPCGNARTSIMAFLGDQSDED